MEKAAPSIKAMLTRRGMGYGKNETKESMIDRLIEVNMTEQPVDRSKKSEVQEKKGRHDPSPVLTEEEIRSAVQANIAAGMKVDFNESGWRFTYGSPDRLKQDSGSFQMPINVIKRIANLIRPAV